MSAAVSPLHAAPFCFGRLLEAFGLLGDSPPPEERTREDASVVAAMFRRLVGVSKYLEVADTSKVDLLGLSEWRYLERFLTERFDGNHGRVQEELGEIAEVLERRASGEQGLSIGSPTADLFRAIVDYVAVNPVPPNVGAE